ncbi:hypothetical protein PJE062_1497 [Pseudovibrio sp. JE062]|nr:hypothetical protein PJE062_1497 [Pseudovibrio sp. JE062]
MELSFITDAEFAYKKQNRSGRDPQNEGECALEIRWNINGTILRGKPF